MIGAISAGIAGFASGVLSNHFLVATALGFSPVSEVTGAALYAFAVGEPWLMVPATIANLLVAPVLLLLWEILNIPYWGRKILGRHLEKRMHEVGHKYDQYGTLGLAIFIAIPIIPGTGAYTGTLIGELLDLKRSHIIFGSAIGVLITAAMMYAGLAWAPELAKSLLAMRPL